MNTATPSFISTRTGDAVPFRKSIVQGSAADGGLLVPSTFSPMSWDEIMEMREKGPEGIASSLLRRFIPTDEMNDFDLDQICSTALTFRIPLEQLDDRTFILRLDQGPTASFKDIAARSLAGLMEWVCEKEGTKINLIVATSGDTGVAIADAFINSSNISVTVLYPSDGVSPVQEAQMIDVDQRAKNVRCYPIQGNFDRAQDYAKLLQALRGLPGKVEGKLEAAAALEDDIRARLLESVPDGVEMKVEGLVKEVSDVQDQVRLKLGELLSQKQIIDLAKRVDALNLSSANSINIWRLLPQMVQYFHGYMEAVNQGKMHMGEEVVFAVPSGNVGHLMAGIYAKELGLPVKKFIAATNANNILAYAIGSGVLRHKGFRHTESPSMDILDPSNLERLLQYAAWKTGDTSKIDYEGMKTVIKQMQHAIEQGEELPTEWMEGIPLERYGVTPTMLKYLKSIIWAEDVREDDEALAKVRDVYKKTTKFAGTNKEIPGLILEPHGIIPVIATERARVDSRFDAKESPVISFETAHPGKFPKAVRTARIDPRHIPKHPTLSQLSLENIEGRRRPVIQGIEAVLSAIEETVKNTNS